MQPYFLPYLGHWQLMSKVDTWLVFDDIQFIQKGWINRNKITNIQDDSKHLYLNIPLTGRHRKTLIKDIKINNQNDWRRILSRQFGSLEKQAHYFHEANDFLNHVLDFQTKWLIEFLFYSIELTQSLLNLNNSLMRQSADCSSVHSGLEIGPDGWALELTQLIGAKHYINPEGGKHLFLPDKFKKAGISLSFLRPQLPKDTNGKIELGWDKSIIEPIARYGISRVQQEILKGTVELKS